LLSLVFFSSSENTLGIVTDPASTAISNRATSFCICDILVCFGIKVQYGIPRKP